MNPFIVYAFQSAVAISLFYMIYWLFLHKETFFGFNRYYFLASMIIALILPFFGTGNLFPPQESLHLSASDNGYQLLNTTIPAQTALPMAEVTGSYDFLAILSWLYFAGAGLLLLRLMVQATGLTWKISHSRKMKIAGMRIVVDPKTVSPYSFFSWVFIAPDQVGEKHLSDVLAHENEHIRKRHTIDLILIELIIAFQWFNPFVWIMRRSMKETHEYLADQAVLRRGMPVQDYQKLLLSYALGIAQPALITPLNFSLNKKRMTMMKKMKSPNIRKWRSLALLPVAIFLSFAFTDPFDHGKTTVSGTETIAQNITDTLKPQPPEPMYFLNGERTTLETVKTLDTDKIKHINVLIGEKAKSEYGDDGANGVVFITTKIIFDEGNTRQYAARGKVTDALTGKPMQDVNIVVNNTTRGTTTGKDGKFELPLEKEQEKVSFSFVGYRPEIIDLKPGNDVEIKLKKARAMIILPPPENNPGEKFRAALKSQKSQAPAKAQEYMIVESMPEFPGGMQGLSNYIASKVSHPAHPDGKENSRVWVNFTVSETGKVMNVHVDKSIEPGLDNEAVRVIANMPPWEPATQRGRPVPVELSVNVDFGL